MKEIACIVHFRSVFLCFFKAKTMHIQLCFSFHSSATSFKISSFGPQKISIKSNYRQARACTCSRSKTSILCPDHLSHTLAVWAITQSYSRQDGKPRNTLANTRQTSTEQTQPTTKVHWTPVSQSSPNVLRLLRQELAQPPPESSHTFHAPPPPARSRWSLRMPDGFTSPLTARKDCYCITYTSKHAIPRQYYVRDLALF